MGNYKHDCTSNFPEACRGECRETPTPQKFVDEVESLSAILHEIYMKEAERQGDVRHDWDYSKLKESTKEYDRVLARYILEREATSHDEGVREEREEAEKEKNDLLLVISNLIDVINKHAIHGPLCVGSKNYCECGLLDALSASQAIRSRQRSSNE